MALNLSKLFANNTGEGSFHTNIALKPKLRETLLDARRVTRAWLRERVPQQLSLHIENPPRPRFVTQGSFSYKTILQPIAPPPAG